MVKASGAQWALFVALGLLITVLIEWPATRGLWVSRWTYSPLMPLLPGTAIGFAPVVQWFVLPSLAVWFTGRHIQRRRGAGADCETRAQGPGA